MSWDLDETIATLRMNSRVGSSGRCAKFVRIALESGGISLMRTEHAKDYGRSLESAGFRVVNRHSCIAPRRGDIAVIQPLLDEIHGHMAMYDGEIWISDFKQRSMYPGPEYRRQQPDFAIYRKRD